MESLSSNPASKLSSCLNLFAVLESSKWKRPDKDNTENPDRTVLLALVRHASAAPSTKGQL